MELIKKSEAEVNNQEVLAIERLIKATWPDPNGKQFSNEELIADFKNRTPGKSSYLLYDNNLLIGYSETFIREVETTNGRLNVLGLGAVCIAKSQRGKGLGAKIIEEIFKQLPLPEAEVCLFQTGVPGFYEKLHCQLVSNQFINSCNTENPQANPFWDEYTMIYPKTYGWPSGTIDLRGPGF